MKAKWKIVLPILIILLIGGAFSGLLLNQYNNSSSKTENEAPKEVKAHQNKQVETAEKSYRTEATISAVGDLLIHSTVYEAAQTGENSYNFNPMLERVKQYLQETDISIANQETIIGGTEIGLSNYPSFNSPFEVADALQEAGVDIVSIANNHTLDRGEKAIMNAINHYETIDMQYVGGYKSEEDRATLRTITENGITFSFLSYTYGTNGIPVPEGKEYFVNLIDREKIERDVKEAKENSDVVVVAMHWGVEYILLPNSEQEDLADFLAGLNVDIVIGHHPHVLQPMKFLDRPDGKKMFVVYSLGNFLSGQKDDYKDIGGILQLRVEKFVDGAETNIDIKVDDFIPTYVSQVNPTKYHVVPLKDASNFGFSNGAAKHDEMMEHMYQWINGDTSN
ncbi:poly-gamma-glutamate synthesis protein (capsule biosynthesis protein) [Bacillus tianshenii]|uniref:Poly-gamma-glutamate synthesis protein (Capsule biosynthesis protein) n=1 Tax=Sutcliffiella tianshenii TaxID=1463404 RepID=A0ABS2NWU4_9BACI|nr:poly-gamma-glutamate synthesis protein (capsule biosynthesis protein) [Bacillus tianshenii]